MQLGPNDERPENGQAWKDRSSGWPTWEPPKPWESETQSILCCSAKPMALPPVAPWFQKCPHEPPGKSCHPTPQADRCSHPPLGKPIYSKAASGTLLLEGATTRREVPRRVVVLAPQCHQGKWSGNFQELEEFPLCLCRMERSWQHWNIILFCSKERFNGSKINFRM